MENSTTPANIAEHDLGSVGVPSLLRKHQHLSISRTETTWALFGLLMLSQGWHRASSQQMLVELKSPGTSSCQGWADVAGHGLLLLNAPKLQARGVH